MIEKLKIYTYVNASTSTPFPNVENQIEIEEYTYTSQRMGSVSLSATLMYPNCLDKVWTGNEYVTFQGEKYFIRQTPTSSKNNEDERYKHELNFLSERSILDTVYFYDVVTSNTSVDRYASNSTKVVFYGDINELVARLNYSLAYSNLGYKVVIDDGISSKAMQVSFDDMFISDVLQEIFNQYELAYYFVGKIIHVGFMSNAITTPFKYGAENNLLSITKTNANYKIVNRCTGVGSTDNIPYYYPNESDDREAIEASGKQWITPSQNLMPSIYRTSNGAERFYNALNNTYTNPETGLKYIFENPYLGNNPSEHKVTFEDIKPTIKGMTNASGQLLGEIADIAFDAYDNDDMDEEGNYLHPYFFVKLHKFNGTNGFNLFEQAIEQSEMTISMTSGVCGACEFIIGVDKESQKNLVQVNDNGDLLRDENGNVRCGREFMPQETAQDRQNDTINYECWIALKKEYSTFGVIMPNHTNNYHPNIGDNFVILYIKLPQAYITAAEKRLDEQIIDYMANNNSEKFNFSINFSRIYLENNPDVANQINENARLLLEYDNSQYTLYVSTYTYRVTDDAPLPEITVELTDTITINRSSLLTAIDSVKADIMNSIGSADFYKQGLKYFIRKDRNDFANGYITFLNGLQVGDYNPGWLGKGGIFNIDKKTGKTTLVADNIQARDTFEAMTFRFNRIDVIDGEQWSTFAFGKIKSVDTKNQIVYLDLVEGEITSVKINDLCRGIFHSFQENGNETSNSTDDCNFPTIAGFKTSYFTPTSILEDGSGFYYALRAGTTVHPCAEMNFACYGNLTDKDRQSSTYATRDRLVMLQNVNTWIIDPAKNYVYVRGKLDGLSYSGMTFKGYGTIQGNSYIYGSQIQFTPDQIDELSGSDAYSVNLSNSEYTIKVDTLGDIIGGYTMQANVVNGTYNIINADNNIVTTIPAIQTRIQAFKGASEMFYSETYAENSFTVTITPNNCTASITNGILIIDSISSLKDCYVDLIINCEGNVEFSKTFKINAIADGQSSVYADLSNEFVSVMCDTNGSYLFGLPQTIETSMFYGDSEMTISNVTIGNVSNVGISVDENKNVVISSIETQAPDTIVIPITMSASSFDGTIYTRTKNITLNKVVKGSNGENAVLYSLRPSSNNVKIDADGNSSVSHVHCDVFKNDGNAVTKLTSLPNDIIMYYMMNKSGQYVKYKLGYNLPITDTVNVITFEIWKGSILLDIEDVVVVKDGSNGKDGKDGKDGTDGTDGTNGVDAMQYWLVSNTTQIGINNIGAIEPSSVTIYAKQKQGVGTISNSSANFITIFAQKENSTSWIRIDASSSQRSSATFNTSLTYNRYKACLSTSAITTLNDNAYTYIIDELDINLIKNGDNVAKGSMPRNKGEYDASGTTHYVWDENYRDIVYRYENNNLSVYIVKSFGADISGTWNASNWTQANLSDFSAFNTILADGANIAGFMYKDGKMQSQDTTDGNPNTLINGQTGEITCNSLNARGDIECNKIIINKNFIKKGESWNVWTINSSRTLWERNLDMSKSAYEFDKLGLIAESPSIYSMKVILDNYERGLSSELYGLIQYGCTLTIELQGNYRYYSRNGNLSNYITLMTSNLPSTSTGKFFPFHISIICLGFGIGSNNLVGITYDDFAGTIDPA